eukprot:scaffold216107_cov23-Cyclotella_meneghiniana.AAC.1
MALNVFCINCLVLTSGTNVSATTSFAMDANCSSLYIDSNVNNKGGATWLLPFTSPPIKSIQSSVDDNVVS